MALLFMDSFDHYATADLAEKWTASGAVGSGSAVAIVSTAGRRSSGCFRWTTGTSGTGTGWVQKTSLTPGDATCIMGFALSLSAAGGVGSTGLALASLRDGPSTTQVTLRLNADLTLSVVRGNQDGVTLGTSSAPITVGGYTYVEWLATIHNSTGVVVVRLNGTVVLSLTGQDTQSTAAAQWTSFFIGSTAGAANSVAASRLLDWDDLYVLDGTGPAPWNTFLGDCRVDVRAPIGPGASAAWTPSATPNWACVDDPTPNDDTDYTESAAVGATDTFTTQVAPVPGAVLYGVQHCLALRKTDAGTCTIAPVIRYLGTDYPGAALSPGTAYAYGLAIAATNPASGAQWTEAEFNAAEFGYRRTG